MLNWEGKNFIELKINQIEQNVMCGRQSQEHVSHLCKAFLFYFFKFFIQTLIKQLLTKYQTFTNLNQISYTLKNHIF